SRCPRRRRHGCWPCCVPRSPARAERHRAPQCDATVTASGAAERLRGLTLREFSGSRGRVRPVGRPGAKEPQMSSAVVDRSIVEAPAPGPGPGERLRRLVSPPRINALDAARALAILGMIGAHVGNIPPFDPSAPLSYLSV